MKPINLDAVKVYSAIMASALFWGCSFVWTKIVFNYWGVITTIFIRLVISTLLLVAIIALFKKYQRIEKKDYKLLFVSALFNPFFYFLGENFGVLYSTPTVASVMIATIPVFTLVAAAIFTKERMSVISVSGLLLSVVGVVVMLLNLNSNFEANTFGVLALFFAVISATGYAIFLKFLSQKYNAFMIVAGQNIIGAVLFLPLFLYFEYDQFIVTKITFQLGSTILMLSLFASTFAFVFFTYSTRKIGVSRTTVFTNIIPLFTAALSWYLLDEKMNLYAILGIFIVVFGVFLSQSNAKIFRKREKIHGEEKK